MATYHMATRIQDLPGPMIFRGRKRQSGIAEADGPHGSFLWVNKTTIEIWNIPTYGCIIDIYIYI